MIDYEMLTSLSRNVGFYVWFTGRKHNSGGFHKTQTTTQSTKREKTNEEGITPKEEISSKFIWELLTENIL